MIRTVHKKVVIIGGGPAGLSAACEFKRRGIEDVIILERERELGGILRQCIHDGFGTVRFKQSLTGPEYAERFIEKIHSENIEYKTETTVLNITRDRVITAASRDGLINYKADVIVLAMGCRERTRGALSIPGSRPAGVYTAGVAQAYINLKNLMVGKDVVILGSGDIGLIMARRLTLEGAKVHGVFEIKPYPNGLSRNIEQCLNDYDIPLYTSHTVTDIKGKERLSSVTVSQVDNSLTPIPGTEREYPCDTLILSVGLIPENELTRGVGAIIDSKTNGPVVDEYYRTSVPGIFAAGNVLHVHDLADFVSEEAELLVEGAIRFLERGLPETKINVSVGDGIGNVTPQKVCGECDVKLSFRAAQPYKNVEVAAVQNGKKIAAVFFKKLLPAEMNSIEIKSHAILTRDEIKVVVSDA